VRGLYAWLAGSVGGIAAYRVFRRRRDAVESAPPGSEPRAEELRTKLAEARVAEGEEAAAVPADDPADPDARRRSVHDQARSVIDEMRSE
jgi:hypothetical protein